MAGAFELNIAAAFDTFARGVSEIERENIPFVTAYALTKTAQDVEAAEVEGMGSAFDRPTRFTLNALQVTPATKRDLRAAVTFKQGFGSIPASRYLGPEVEGGGRVHKSHERALVRAGVMGSNEYAVPSKLAPLDGNGNMKGAMISRILVDVMANPDTRSNSTGKTRARARRRGRGIYFVVRGRPNMPDGIYFRLGMRDIRPMLLFVRQPTYSKRLPFYETASDVVSRRLPVHFAEGWGRFGHQRRPT